jgi:5'-deoxynucleotidase YfbR-like HD superfamily hydrolase
VFSYYERMMAVVPRWSIVPRLNKQSVAEHVYFVALYASKLAQMLKLPPEEALATIEYALRHDSEEIWTSDIPSPTKRAIVDKERNSAFEAQLFKRLGPDYAVRQSATDLQRDIVKAADFIDWLFWVSLEVAMGNNTMRKQVAIVGAKLFTALQKLGLGEIYPSILSEASEFETGVTLPDSIEHG